MGRSGTAAAMQNLARRAVRRVPILVHHLAIHHLHRAIVARHRVIQARRAAIAAVVHRAPAAVHRRVSHPTMA